MNLQLFKDFSMVSALSVGAYASSYESTAVSVVFGFLAAGRTCLAFHDKYHDDRDDPSKPKSP